MPDTERNLRRNLLTKASVLLDNLDTDDPQVAAANVINLLINAATNLNATR